MAAGCAAVAGIGSGKIGTACARFTDPRSRSGVKIFARSWRSGSALPRRKGVTAAT